MSSSKLKPVLFFWSKPASSDADGAATLEADAGTKDESSKTEKDVTGVPDEPADNAPDSNDQEGIQRVEAITLMWSKKSLIAAYVL